MLDRFIATKQGYVSDVPLDEELHDGGLHAGQVACERSVRLYLFESLLVEYLPTQKSTDMLHTAL